jgi:pyruvate formate lyase activating enzyme
VRWVPAVLYERHASRLRCEVCPLRCVLDDGDVGTCRVRRRSGALMETATFATSVEHVDPVERKPFYHYRPGRRVLTLAAPGCTFRCDYCVNHRISQFGREPGTEWTATPADPDRLVAAAAGGGADICLSYTEPSLAIELTQALAERGGPAGVRVLWKSNGFLTPRAVAAVAWPPSGRTCRGTCCASRRRSG